MLFRSVLVLKAARGVLLFFDDWMQLPFGQTALTAIQDALSLRRSLTSQYFRRLSRPGSSLTSLPYLACNRWLVCHAHYAVRCPASHHRPNLQLLTVICHAEQKIESAHLSTMDSLAMTKAPTATGARLKCQPGTTQSQERDWVCWIN